MTSAAWARAYLASHPDVAARFSAYEREDIINTLAAMRDETLRLERERCVAHLELGRACGDLGLAEKAIQDGVSVESMSEKYLDLAMHKGGFEGASVRHALAHEVRS